jgi:hypothetical protein
MIKEVINMKKFTNLRKVRIGISVSEYWSDNARSTKHRQKMREHKSEAHKKKISKALVIAWQKRKEQERIKMDKEIQKYLESREADTKKEE